MTLLPFSAIVKRLNLYTFKAYIMPSLSHEEFLIYSQVHYVLRLPQNYEDKQKFAEVFCFAYTPTPFRRSYFYWLG